jgi:tRNA-guanine family transglycosylase
VMDIQLALGSDILMAFDECAPIPATTPTPPPRWSGRTAGRSAAGCSGARGGRRSRSCTGSLFGIVQGGTYLDLGRERARHRGARLSGQRHRRRLGGGAEGGDAGGDGAHRPAPPGGPARAT